MHGLCLDVTETRNINAELKPTFVDTNIINRGSKYGWRYRQHLATLIAHMTLVHMKVLKVQSDPPHGSPNDIPRGNFETFLCFGVEFL